MIAVDTNVWVDFFNGVKSPSTERLAVALDDESIVMPPPVLFEILSGTGLSPAIKQTLAEVPPLEILPGYWERAGELRRKILANGNKARGMDCLIAQLCIDNGVGLLTNDRDYRNFSHSGLVLIKVAGK